MKSATRCVSRSVAWLDVALVCGTPLGARRALRSAASPRRLRWRERGGEGLEPAHKAGVVAVSAGSGVRPGMLRPTVPFGPLVIARAGNVELATLRMCRHFRALALRITGLGVGFAATDCGISGQRTAPLSSAKSASGSKAAASGTGSTAASGARSSAACGQIGRAVSLSSPMALIDRYSARKA